MVTIPKHTTRQQEALEHAQKHWLRREQERGQAPVPSPPDFTIAIARQAGALGTSIAHEVARRLGWPVFDHELVALIAEEMGLRVNLIESVDERRQSWILEALETFAVTHFVSENSYVRNLIQTILALGAHGQCVIVGRGAPQILSPATTLRIRLIGDRKDRVARVATLLGLEASAAARKTEEIDRERSGFIKDHFHRDPADPLHYDLVINTSRWAVNGSADLIVHALGQLQVGASG